MLGGTGRGAPAAQTVFVGGGTPSLLGADGLADVLGAVRAVVRSRSRRGGDHRIESGVDLARVLRPHPRSGIHPGLARACSPPRRTCWPYSTAPTLRAAPVAAAREARAAGFDHVNLDLIYGTPGERDSDLEASLDAVLDAGVDHVSAYALIVEDGTALARRVRRGELPAPDDDVLATRYERIDARLQDAGMTWYEVSNWAAAQDPSARCAHNLGYWDGGDWWGAGPGAHSHVGGTRWWNVKHPARYAGILADGRLPVGGSERLSAEDVHTEVVMLTVRLRTGLPLGVLDAGERVAADSVVADGLAQISDEHLVLTDRGRLLADAVVRTILLGAEG